MESSLNAARRARDLDDARDEVADLLVVGLGATGAGVALDAAARGLSVVAIDAHDLAFGTSRWSSKLIHGGLRYLASGQIGLARESAAERHVLIRHTAPHLVKAQPYLLPLTPAVPAATARKLMTGYRLGDVLRAAAGTPRKLIPGPARLGAAEALDLVPALAADGLRGALRSYDGRVVDDARLVVALARTAAGHGARVLTRCRALGLAGDGAEVRDELSGDTFTIRAEAVVNATGVWAGGLAPEITLRPSRGTHLVLREGVLGPLQAGLHVPMPGELSRFLLVLPQSDGHVLVGLTDEPVEGPVPDVPDVPEGDVEFLLATLNGVLDVPVTRDQVAGAYAGLRPLLDTGTGRTADLSRRHAVLRGKDGVVTVVGGKLTTYRRMAEDAVDAACPQARRSTTARLPLVGATTRGVRAPWRLIERYGSEAEDIAALIASNRALGAKVLPGQPTTWAELVWAVRHEGALDADDLLDRRTRIGLVPEDREAALTVARHVLSLQP
ncbi:glycerol-3-phosphate dehydrogenase/oxidase [Herbidospora sp. NBRC 101105]|uniref:glycerol-3-phosphate dehydrogenase/oxidase n=1 Tax=Herbidospora sp. NBRC 101105 TaxID=3032195 RepID=UPI0024A42724|nr:glycerol-3-phosphate dehydrogenase/oxidase [Herbidospora sp. NBRC 101105]GLX94298.1 glycerol-3-phosphate dehydrogenase [Herbidospora sp. NBRC 101105]